jgi:hypothetical protein
MNTLAFVQCVAKDTMEAAALDMAAALCHNRDDLVSKTHYLGVQSFLSFAPP